MPELSHRFSYRKDRIKTAKWGELFSKVKKCHIAIVVLDARNPLGTFSKRLWSMLERIDRRRLIVLNKVDLIPREVGFAWARLLEREYRASVLPVSATRRIGTLRLRKLLRKEARELGEEKVVCLVAGVPKTGKSSIINVLRGRHSAPTSLYPGTSGYTKSYTLYRIESNIYIIDTPGVAPDIPDRLERIVRLYPPERIPDPIVTAVEIINRVTSFKQDAIREVYDIEGRDPITVLESIAKRRGWIKRGCNEPLIVQAAITVIRDYLSGRLPFYVDPPRRKEVT